MSTTLTPPTGPVPEGDASQRGRARIAKRVGVWVVVLAIVGLVTGALVVFAWMIDETHFDRPSAQFDAFRAQLDDLPGVDVVDAERWVEAPTFSSPTSWLSVTVDEAAVAGLLAAACSTDYPDAVTWSINVRTPTAAEVLLNASSGADPCVDFGFDAVGLVAVLDRVAPGLAIQPAIWENGRFALVALEDEAPGGFTHLLPLVEHAEELLAAASLGSGDVIEINSANLGFTLEPGESDRYLSLLRELADDHAVQSFWADGGGAQTDGIAKVQIVAPTSQHESIEDAIRTSGVHIADLPVRFLEY